MFRGGDIIEYEICKTPRPITLRGSTHNTIESIHSYLDTNEFINIPNIKVINMFSKYWDKIVEYMDSRVSSLCGVSK